MNLTEQLASIPYSSAPIVFSDGRDETWLRRFLDRNGIRFNYSGGKFRLAQCPLCGEAEGNPAVWIQRGAPCFVCFRANHCNGEPKKTFADLERHFAPARKLQRLDIADLIDNYNVPSVPVIKGLINRGDVVNVVGGPKTRKSFLVMQLALSIASGRPFLGFETVRGKVCIYDNELRPNTLAARAKRMAEAMGIDARSLAGWLDFIPLRGMLADIHTIRQDLQALPPDTYSMVVLDAWYKALPRGTDENANGDMTAAYLMLDSAAEAHGCAMGVVHHTSKGIQSGKSVTDVGAGAGAQSRSADAHIVLREHDDPETVVLAAVLRSQAPIKPRCLTFQYPLWTLAEDKDPAALAVPNKKPVPKLAEFVALVPAEPAPEVQTTKEIASRLGCSGKTAFALLCEAIHAGLVVQQQPKRLNQPRTFRRADKSKTASV